MNALQVDLPKARSALQMVARQASELVRLLPNPQAPVPGLTGRSARPPPTWWRAPMNYLRYATGQAAPASAIDLRVGNLERIRQVGSQDLTELANLLVEETDRYLEGTAELSADHRVRFMAKLR